MVSLGTKEFQLGREGPWVDTHRMEGSLMLELHGCPQCGKTEFFCEHGLIEEALTVFRCPVCHARYPVTEERCPKCLTRREESP